MHRKLPGNVTRLEDFVTQTGDPKSPIQETIKLLVRQINREKLNYIQFRYIMRVARERCELGPTRTGKRLLELPTSEELRLFYGAINSPTHKLIFEVLEGTGLRIAELCNLRIDRIDFSTNTAFVSQGKGGKDRIIVFGNRLKEKLQIFLEKKKNRYLFESSRCTKFSPRRIEQLCKQYKEKSEIQHDLTPHTFRHIWNTRLAEKGFSKERRMILAGHSSEKTQEIYTHLSLGGFKDEAIRLLDV